MKKFVLPVLLLTATAMFTACGSLGTSSSSSSASSSAGSIISSVLSSSGTSSSSSSSSSSTGGIIGGLLSNLLGSSSALSQDALVGTWKYTSPDCVFESENLLMKAGGEVAAAKIESEMSGALAKVGIKSGSCKFTFNADGTYSAVIGSRTVSGKYTLDADKKTITMTYLAGLATMEPKISKSGNTISLLFESDKLLTLLKGVSALSSNTSVKTLSSLLGSYDGLYVGIKMQK